MRWRPLILAGAVLLAVSINAGSQEQKPAKSLTPEQQEKLKERDRLVNEAAKLQMAGKLAETITVVERAVTLHREALGKDDPGIIDLLTPLATLYGQRENFAAASGAGAPHGPANPKPTRNFVDSRGGRAGTA